MYEDKTLVCKDCGNEFVFTAGEQEFYAEKVVTRESMPFVNNTTLFALLAARNVKFRSSQQATALFIAVSALLKCRKKMHN